MKALRTAAFVVGAAALVATGIGAAGAAGLLGTAVASGGAIAGIATAATFTAIGTVFSVAAAVTSFALGSPKPRGTMGGNPTKFTINKESGYPYAIGRTYSGGRVVHRQYYGSKNSLESWVTVHSIGPIKSLGPLEVDKQIEPFSAGAATGTYAGHMWLDEQLGTCPETRALAGPQGPFPGWDTSSKLSGLAADLWTLKFDEKGKKYPTGVPQRGRVVEGVFVYDPRFDSTYPGGSGACRLGNEATYVWSENPALHAITWAYGRIQNGILIGGGGLAVKGIDLAPFVEWANVCEVNNWKAGGIVYTADDDSWDVLKMIAQAGGGEVMPVGALLSCTFNAPRVSIGLITSNDIIGDVDVPGSAPRRQRRNTVIPRVRLETHGWEMVPLEATEIPDYIAADGGRRPKEVILPLVQDANQGVQLGLYELWNARELSPIVLPCKVYALGYRPGDCLTVNIPEANLINREVVVREREIAGGNFGVTLTCRTETAGKHPFCLGKTGTPPPTPNLAVPDFYQNGQATFVHIAYADSSDGTANFTTGEPGDRSYLGIRTDNVPEESTSPGDYAWSLIRGRDGTNGLNGTDGLNGTNGADGQTSFVHFAFANSPDGTTDFTTGAAEGRYYVGVYTDFNPADSPDPASYTWSLFRGADGNDGIPGARGENGETTYVHIAYSNSADGVTDFTTGAPDGRTYIGLRSDFVLADSTNPADYSWSLIKGADGANGADALSPSPSPPTHTVSCDFGGTPKPGQGSKSSVMNVVAGTTNVTGTATFAIKSTSGCGASMSGATLTINAFSADSGYAEVTISYGGASIDQRVTFSKARDGAPGNSNSASISVSASTSWTDSSSVVSLAVQGAGTVNASASWLSASPNNTVSGGVRILYRPGGTSTWSVLVEAENGVPAQEPFDVFANASFGTSAAGVYEFIVQTYRSGPHGAITPGRLNVSWQP